MQKITPYLWFDKQAEEAAQLYISAFGDAKINRVAKFDGSPSGEVTIVNMDILGLTFDLMNAGPYFKINPSISFLIACATAEEVDAINAKLAPGGKVRMEIGSYPFSSRYVWIEDKFGVNWQLMCMDGKPFPAERRVTPTVMFIGPNTGKAEEAMTFYQSVFKNSSQGPIARYPAGGQDKEGTVMHGSFVLDGVGLAAMDSAYNHEFALNEAVSFAITVKDQEEHDYFMEKLSAVPEAEQCGWLKDKYGLSWQMEPANLMDLMTDPDKGKSQRVIKAVLEMKRLDMAALQRAYDGK